MIFLATVCILSLLAAIASYLYQRGQKDELTLRQREDYDLTKRWDRP